MNLFRSQPGWLSLRVEVVINLFALIVIVVFIIFAISFYLLFVWFFVHSALIFLLISTSSDAEVLRVQVRWRWLELLNSL